MNVRGGLVFRVSLCVLVLIASVGRADRTKRSFLNMFNQIGHLFDLGYTFANYLRDYGCWCGVGGSGTPQDNIDRCCMVHDRCYDQNSRDGCSGIHLDDYSYEWTSLSISCTNSPGSCDYKNCNCDKEFLECLRSASFPRTFLPGLRNFNKYG
ncbi:secretory phospholipase A2 [Mytilus galloprovincialis]|uniref:Phospholipase A2 n=1 Tax=Mytilus galloprovincialis TaxID=29158 RepID=A0A8B6FZU9_MYTGA|nr:secretory phospholipase A2 [Mytilus galloprovincialis]